MSKATKIWLIVAAALVLVGGMIFAVTMSSINWDFLSLDTSDYETNEYVIEEKFNDISFDIETADVEFLLSEDDKIKVVCYEEENVKHNVKVEDKTLNITVDNQKKWYENIGVSFDTPTITVYLPKSVNDPAGEYGSLTVKSNTGYFTVPECFVFDNIDINLSTGDVSCFASCENECNITTSTGCIETKSMSADSISLCTSTGEISAESIKCDDMYTKVSTGRTYLSDVKCVNFTSEGTTGALELDNVIAKSDMIINRSTGNVIFDDCDASQVYIATSTGSVNGNFLSDKIFNADSSTGSINVPTSTKGGLCEIHTDTGSINIEK